MDDLTLIRMARAKAHEALAELEAAAEFMPNGPSSDGDLKAHLERVDDLRRWLFDESWMA